MYFEPTTFIYTAAIFAIGMLVWDTIEVGRNDAANIINAVFGARVLKRKVAIRLAAVAVLLGAWAASPVIETTRRGIFDPEQLSLVEAITIYASVYLTDTVILFSFSTFGMPISTTACMVFELLGASFAIGGLEVIFLGKSMQVVCAIFASILFSGAGAFLVQRAFRGSIGQDCEDTQKVALHGPWISGALLTGLVYFILIKGMKSVPLVQSLRNWTLDELGTPMVLLVLWVLLSIIVWGILKIGGEKVHRNLFGGLSVLGMLAIAVAFGQNDLGTCASPGVASYMILRHQSLASSMSVPPYILLICGMFLAIGMSTKTAQRVTRAQVNTGSQGDIVRLYAPRWCLWVAHKLCPPKPDSDVLAPKPIIEPHKKIQHYDALRAAVITSVSASVIAFASGMGLPVSTTYVSFAAIVSTGWADKIFHRGDAQLKIGRTIWVVFCWFFSALIAFCAAAVCATIVSVSRETIGPVIILLLLVVNISIRNMMKKRSARQEERLRQEAAERKQQLYQNYHPSSPSQTVDDLDDADDA
jgi:phosphate/sulfate permease